MSFSDLQHKANKINVKKTTISSNSNCPQVTPANNQMTTTEWSNTMCFVLKRCSINGTNRTNNTQKKGIFCHFCKQKNQQNGTKTNKIAQ